MCQSTTISSEEMTVTQFAANPLETIRYQVQCMAQSVEKAVGYAIISLVDAEAYTAFQVIAEDKTINSFEIDIDNSTFNALALSNGRMPPDMLRRILAIQKINPMLERIGDHAVNIAESVLALTGLKEKAGLFGIPEMANLCKKALHDALSGFFDNDLPFVTEVLTRDDTIDGMNIAISADIKNTLIHDPGKLSFDAGFELIGICKNLERIADLAMNIAEEAVFAIDGSVLKHRDTCS